MSISDWPSEIGYIGDPRAGRVIRHYQFINWYVDCFAPSLSRPNLFRVVETRDTRRNLVCDGKSFKDAFRAYCEHINKMSRQAGFECDHPDRRLLEFSK